MHDRTRDLERIQERDGEDHGRRVGVVLSAALAVAALTLAIGLAVGRAAEPAAAEAVDPLDRLASVGGATPGKPADTDEGVVTSDLTFPQTLTDQEDRPEVLAALRAAALEEASLAAPARDPDGPSRAISARIAAGEPRGASAPNAAPDALVVAAAHDAAVEAADEAPIGAPGEYTLQVVSYDTAQAARAFARDLRARGHRAFVADADAPGRGRYWRVRIGPFASMREAEAYRRSFETTEAMNTFVVRRGADE